MGPTTPHDVDKKQPTSPDSSVTLPNHPEHSRPRSRYSVNFPLGAGTYGDVYQARDTQRGKDVALKVAKPELPYRISALTEAKVLKQLQNCASVVDYVWHFETTDHRVVIVTELWGCTALDSMCARNNQPFSLPAIRTIALTVLQSLKDLNQIGYIHCDIKPENVMLRNPHKFDEVCLIDFGSVRKHEENRYYDVQSLWYRAPEVLCSFPYDQKIDVWSLGCMMCELFTGNPLFAGADPGDQLRLITKRAGKPSAAAMGALKRTDPTLFSSIERVQEGAVSMSHFLLRCMAGCTEHVNGDELEHFVSLLVGLLNPIPERRLSTDEALAHPFLTPRACAVPALDASTYAVPPTTEVSPTEQTTPHSETSTEDDLLSDASHSDSSEDDDDMSEADGCPAITESTTSTTPTNNVQTDTPPPQPLSQPLHYDAYSPGEFCTTAMNPMTPIEPPPSPPCCPELTDPTRHHTVTLLTTPDVCGNPFFDMDEVLCGERYHSVPSSFLHDGFSSQHSTPPSSQGESYMPPSYQIYIESDGEDEDDIEEQPNTPCQSDHSSIWTACAG